MPEAVVEVGKRLILASSNPGKIIEFETLLSPLGWQVESLAGYTQNQVEETAPSYLENALHKARSASQLSGLPAIADDSGLEVDELHGLPGVRSARFAGENANDQQNLEFLLRKLSGVPDHRRSACFRCLMVYLQRPEDPAPVVVQGIWQGRILDAPRGRGGFGYDPVFYIPEQDRSAAELSPEAKNRFSHRGQAVRALVAHLSNV